MVLLTEEHIKKLKEKGLAFPQVTDSCIGCSACVAITPEVFELDDNGKSVVISLDAYSEEDVNNSISACPVDSIYWEK